jgi:hypothetical protein
MEIIGSKVKVIISDPWDMFCVINGLIIQYYPKDEESYFVVEDVDSSEKYFISTRYTGEHLTDIFDRRVVVAIAISENINIPFDSPDFDKHLKYIGIGSIELIKKNF